MDDDGQSRIIRKCQLPFEHAYLLVRGSIDMIKIQPDFTYGDHAFSPYKNGKRRDVLLGDISSFLGVDADRRVNRRVFRSQEYGLPAGGKIDAYADDGGYAGFMRAFKCFFAVCLISGHVKVGMTVNEAQTRLRC
jgi:hypothetical protein